MRLVLDASVALSWLFERSKSSEAACADCVLLALADAETVVPSLWHTEVMNALLIGERRQVVTEAQIMDYLNRLSSLPIAVDDISVITRRDAVMALAREHRLTSYDATYLELALRKEAVLATFDNKLADAMRLAGGRIFVDSQ